MVIKTRIFTNFYKTFIRSLIDYASFQFIVANDSTKSKIQIYQNKIIRLCINANLLDSTTFIHEKASIQMLEERQFQLNTNYIKKLFVKNENELIIKKILQQPITDKIYNDISDHTRQRRTTCLDNYYNKSYFQNQ